MTPFNRTTSPAVQIPKSVDVPKAAPFLLSNGLPIYVIDAGEDEVVRLEIIIPNSSKTGSSYMITSAAHTLADTGTQSKSAEEIAEAFDFFGSFFQSEISPDYRSFTLYSTCRFFSESLPVFIDVVLNSTYPEKELENWKRRNLQTLAVNREKVAWLGRKAFTSELFGSDHPYGFTPEADDFNSITIENLLQFKHQNEDLHHGLIIISGKVGKRILADCEMLSVLPINKNSTGYRFNTQPDKWPTPSKQVIVEKSGSVQFGLRIGMRTITKNHPDFLALTVTNTILGGYFGSRLMSNIREDKGYTYGIGSLLTPYIHAGSLSISTEVGRDVCKPAIKEIYHELNQLASVPVPESELAVVRNYLTGTFLRSLDGPFSIADRFKGLILYELDYDYFNKYLDILNNITPEQMQQTAEQYINPENMIEIISGS